MPRPLTRNQSLVLALSLLLISVPNLMRIFTRPDSSPSQSSSSSIAQSSASAHSSMSSVSSVFGWSLPDAQSRITKKPFGIFITPTTSPVQPERFRGYHTGTDFETFPAEQDQDVSVSAVCSGKVLFRGWVSGYGGLLIQSCTYEGEPVTVLYGHVKNDSITVKKGEPLSMGQSFAVLGKGYSTETDGERKHLHLAVHRGSAIDYKGYVQTADALKQWVNVYP